MGRKMKDSGVEWIGDIPEDWQVGRLKHVCTINGRIGFRGYTQADIVDEGEGAISLSPSNISDTKMVYDKCTYISWDKYEESPEIQIQDNDILMVKTGSSYGKCMMVDNLPQEATINPQLTVIRNKKISNGYLEHVLQSNIIKNQIELVVNGGTIPTMTQHDMYNFYLPIPSQECQEKISTYLNDKIKNYNKVISDIIVSIDTYKSLKQSLITRAVTKGVRGRREMKDSGIEWIGHCPSDWELRPFRYILKERQEKNFPIKSKERLSLSIDLGVTLYAEKTTNLDRFKDDFEQYKLAYPGDLVMNSMNMIVGASGVSDYFGCVSPVYYTFYDDTDNHVTAKFCEYIFRSRAMMRVLFSMGKGIYAIVRGDDRVNTCRLKVSKEDLKSLKLPLPSLDEQQEIVTYLDKKLSDIDTLIVKKEQLVSELENYKKSLIYEYVTGKREVLA